MRRETETVLVGDVPIGSDHPIRIQSMALTDTGDVPSTVAQIKVLVEADAELVRVTVKDERHARAVPEIKRQLKAEGISAPLIGDFHYNGHLLLKAHPDCAKALDKYRINPGNVGIGKHRDRNFEAMIKVAVNFDRPVRIGVNGGSLDQELLDRLMEKDRELPKPEGPKKAFREAMVLSALESADRAIEYGLPPDRIILSAKCSDVRDLVDVYRDLAGGCNFPLHLGLTEAGPGLPGIVASTAALSILLAEGIGDTIRVSVTPETNESGGPDRTREVLLCRHILQALHIRHFTPSVTACPGCGRTASTLFLEIAQEVQAYLDQRMHLWKKKGYKGVENLKVAVMGCVVNGPGEARDADIGLSLPGTGENPSAPVYADGKHVSTLRGKNLTAQFLKILETYVQERFG
ncbi:MAG: flavodoxin-dependent (E)-4-hydroxy-3-methylbut-2-enyl-diphosphate synthase [Armatimonadetes bacterium]|nr:flavodoxin-dependent (E)-4-hydroxy-3-methylbut-2-enyl-diphosphate synthase [Armatimonadota bacterium]